MFIGLSTFLLALLLAIISAFTFWCVINPWDFYRPIIMFIVFYIALLVTWLIVIEIIGAILNKKKHISKNDYRIAKFLLAEGIQCINNHALIRVKFVGRSRLPKNGQRFLYVSNHKSNFDPMIAYVLLKEYNVPFITKPENFKIPFGGKLMRIVDFQAIQRDDPLKSLDTINNCISLIKQDKCSIGVYPEGTRIHSNELGDFHEGVFSIALKAKCPIVISTVRNTEKIHKNFPKRFSYVNFDIVRTIYPEDFSDMTAKALSDMCKEIMNANLERYKRHE